MGNGTRVKSVFVEFNRFDGPGGTLQKGTRYLRTIGFDEPTREIVVGLEYREFAQAFYDLRYSKGMVTDQAALKTLDDEAEKFLAGLPHAAGETTQIDLVTGAAELWAFPFEAWANAESGIILTRRIRGEFAQQTSWPAVPKLLFAHAAIDGDLPATLVKDHVAALREALHPWTGSNPDEKTVEKYLTVREVPTIEALQTARQEAAFTHIHLLAHGIQVKTAPFIDWGMRLGKRYTGIEPTKGVHPQRIAEALTPRNGLPVTVTIASCDSGNQAEDPAAASYSIAQEIHRGGVPVVIASQLPLTMFGSKLLTRHFYESLLRGDDVRLALGNARAVLHQNQKDAFHDWLSVVAYVRLPENYAQHLDRVALEMELAMLRAARDHAGRAIEQKDPNALVIVEELIRDRIRSLEKRYPGLKDDKDRLECQGLLGSAYKRLAEVLHFRGQSVAEQRQELGKAAQYYGDAFKSSPNQHWQGVQQLALQAVLQGELDPIDYAIVKRSAQRAADANKDDFWAQGSLAELHLLAGFAKQEQDLVAAAKAVDEFKLHVKKPEDIDSTRFQFQRYTNWWTLENEFKTDLRAQAAELAARLV